jgi:exoribonuclease-2
VVSGSNGRGVWVKLPRPAVEGRLVAGFEGVDVGETVAATLVSVDVRAGYLDFARFRRAGAA